MRAIFPPSISTLVRASPCGRTTVAFLMRVFTAPAGALAACMGWLGLSAAKPQRKRQPTAAIECAVWPVRRYKPSARLGQLAQIVGLAALLGLRCAQPQPPTHA